MKYLVAFIRSIFCVVKCASNRIPREHSCIALFEHNDRRTVPLQHMRLFIGERRRSSDSLRPALFFYMLHFLNHQSGTAVDVPW